MNENNDCAPEAFVHVTEGERARGFRLHDFSDGTDCGTEEARPRTNAFVKNA
ncbi:MAG: hypothetical protein IJ719_07735 [Clostridia bacterium]|nr:hypothetical protein [Clostridia bacterium]